MKICWKQIWSNAVRKKVQTADQNIRIIHNTTPLINECLAKQKAAVLLSIKTFFTFNETSRLKIYAQFKHCLQVKTVQNKYVFDVVLIYCVVFFTLLNV